jgi:hypothetical protein
MAPRRTSAEQARYERERARRLERTYGITIVEYEMIKEVQGGVCPLCQRAKGISTPLQVDHDHALEEQGMRGSVRGLLCGRDNNRLGWYEAKAERVLQYLASPPAREVLDAGRVPEL